MRHNRKIRGCLLALALTATMPATSAAAESSWRLDTVSSIEGVVELSAVDVGAGQTWVGGTVADSRVSNKEPLVGVWDGTTLNRLPNPGIVRSFDLRLTDLTVVGDDVLAVTNTTSADGITESTILRYSRTQPGQIEVLPHPVKDSNGELNAITSLRDGRALMVGTTGPTLSSTRTLILEQNQDHSGWQRIPSVNPGTGTNKLNAVTDSGWAAGYYTQADEPDRLLPLILHDAGPGAGWVQVSVPDLGPNSTELTAIAATKDGDMFVAGWTGVPADRHAVAMHWNRRNWEVLQPLHGQLTEFNDVAIAADDTVLFAGYTVTPFSEIPELEKWAGGPQLQDIPIALPGIQNPPPPAGSEYPLGGIAAIDPGIAGTPPCAVGWVHIPGQGRFGAIMQPARQ
jgi:hypothetical protein